MGATLIDRIVARFKSLQADVRLAMQEVAKQRAENEAEITAIEVRTLKVVRGIQAENAALAQKLRIAESLDAKITEFLNV